MSGPDPLVGKTLADRFEILERIGEGGTGVVYRAKQLSVDRVIAIKVLGAHVSTDPPADQVPEYVAKYTELFKRNNWSAEEFAGDYSVPIRISVRRIRGF